MVQFFGFSQQADILDKSVSIGFVQFCEVNGSAVGFFVDGMREQAACQAGIRRITFDEGTRCQYQRVCEMRCLDPVVYVLNALLDDRFDVDRPSDVLNDACERLTDFFR